MNTRRHPRTLVEGQRFGMLTVLAEADRQRKPSGASVRAMRCRCDCGAEKVIRLGSITSGTTVSCGCFHKRNSASILKEAATTHGASRTKLYQVWNSMIQRCHNPSNKSFGRYGARGVSVCQEWRDSFEAFAAHVGPRPEGLTIDRYPNHAGNYEPGNVRWATYTEQARNTRRNHLHTIDGVTRCLAEWCEVLGEPWTTVKKRVAAGRDPFTRIRKRRSS